MANAASGPSNFRRFAMCLEIASMLRLNVDVALAIPVLLKIMCSRPCIGAASVVFFEMKDWRLKRGVPLTVTFAMALAGWGVAINFFDKHLFNKSIFMDVPFY
jgi:hypothetical protein